MNTIYITRASQKITEDAFIIDKGEVENAEVIVEAGVIARYTVVPSAGTLSRKIFLQGENDFSGKGVIVEDTDLSIVVEVRGDHASGNLDILAIASENSNISVKGVAKVDHPYKRLNLRVDQVNILLGKQAVVRGVPRLEIATNDIEGGHSCKIHRLGGDAIFYLNSHGLDAGQAEALLLNSEILKHLDTLPPDEKEIFCSNVHKFLTQKK